MKENLAISEVAEEKKPHLCHTKNPIKENRNLNMYEYKQKIQIQYKGDSFGTSNKVKII